VTDLIQIRGLRFVAVCGVLEEERERPQPLNLDLDVEFEGDMAAVSDDLENTINYAELAEIAVATATFSEPQLLESLCERVARALLDHDGRVLAVTVTAEKLHPPIALDIRTVGVRRRVAR
jgi:FolB domain-containing protein